MQTSYPNQESRSNDPIWNFLAEYSFSEHMTEDIWDTPMGGLLFQKIRDLDIPPECLNKIESTLIELVKQTMMHFNQSESEYPIVIHLYCQNRMIKSGNLAKTACDHQSKQTMEKTQMIPSGDTKILGGWGFFIIERARGFQAGSFVGPSNLIDLYLYQEGE